MPGTILSGVLVYFVSSYLLLPSRIVIPTAFIISALTFGLTRYSVLDGENKFNGNKNIIIDSAPEKSVGNRSNLTLCRSKLTFIIVYLIALIITTVASSGYQDLYNPWNQLTAGQFILLACSILMCFFLPGYIIVDLIDKSKRDLEPILKVLLAYVFSVAITGFVGYTLGSLGLASSIKIVLTGIHAILLATLIIRMITGRQFIPGRISSDSLQSYIQSHSSEIIVFTSLFAMVLLCSYVLFDGIIIGDQWFHHGRALSIIGGGYKYQLEDTFYPPFFHGVLASFFSVSAVPTVNAYVSMNFLNIIPVFAFYYFYKMWFPKGNGNWHKASLLACTFFMLSSGFGWINMLTLGFPNQPSSQVASSQLFHIVETRTLDIQRAGSFIITSSPQIGTSLTLVALPLGFILLGLVRKAVYSKKKFTAMLLSISVVGIFSHDEFYLFIITASVLPIIFKLERGRGALYLSFLLSIVLVGILDITFNKLYFTRAYYTTDSISSIPLIVMILFFIGVTWALYATQASYRLGFYISNRLRRFKRRTERISQLKFYIALAIVAVTAYLYLFTFLVWSNLTPEEIQLQQDPYDLPWYIFPLKLGVTGLLAICFLLSYLFKKFQTQVFVFGLIAIIALLLGGYYDEYRFSKYIMASMGAFASILIFRIITFNDTKLKKGFICGLIIASIVISSSLSVLLSTGYIALALQRPDIEEFKVVLRNKVFPSEEDFKLFNYLHKTIHFNNDSIIFPLEYEASDLNLKSFNDQKLANRLQAFVGTPVTSTLKIMENAYKLNASSILAMYSLISSDKNQYILLPKEENASRPLPLTFALENFEKIFENDNYVLLKAPSVYAPSSSRNSLAIVFQPEGTLLSSLLQERELLHFDNKTFNAITGFNFSGQVNKEEKTLSLFNTNKRSTLWSGLLQNGQINYIETKLRDFGNDSVGSTGVVWQAPGVEFHVSLGKNGLQLFEKPKGFTKEQLLAEDQHLNSQTGTWYRLKVLASGNTISIYIDDILKFQSHVTATGGSYIKRVGIRVDHSMAEFHPIMIGYIPLSPQLNLKKQIYYHSYYPTSMFALSNVTYDNFAYGDNSAFSHKTLMLTWDPPSNDTNLRSYLQFLDKGGQIIVLKSGYDSAGAFGKLLNIQQGNLTTYRGISDNSTNKMALTITISGTTRKIDWESLNATAKSYYINDGKKIAPFILEKPYGSLGGKVTFINIKGYFEALYKDPKSFFRTIGKIPGFLNLEDSTHEKEKKMDRAIISRFGQLTGTGPTEIQTSDLLLRNSSDANRASRITISDIPRFSIQKTGQNILENATIEDLKLSGAFSASVKSSGFIFIPSFFDYDYEGIIFPKKINLSLKLLDKRATAQFTATFSNDTGTYKAHFYISDLRQIELENFGSLNSEADNQTLIMKMPQIKSTGEIIANNFFILGQPEINTTFKSFNATVDHSDRYIARKNNLTTEQYVTYLRSVQTEGVQNQNESALKLPADISERAKIKGVTVPWENIMVSQQGLLLLFLIIAITVIISVFRLFQAKQLARRDRKSLR